MSYSRSGYPNQWFEGTRELSVYMSVEDFCMKESIAYNDNPEEYAIDFDMALSDPVNIIEICGTMMEREAGYEYTTRMVERLAILTKSKQCLRKDNLQYICPACNGVLRPEREAGFNARVAHCSNCCVDVDLIRMKVIE